MAEQNWTTVVTKKSRTKAVKEDDGNSQKKPVEVARSFERGASNSNEIKLNQKYKSKGQVPYTGKDDASNIETIKTGGSFKNKNEGEKFGARKNESRNPLFQRDQQNDGYNAKPNLIPALPKPNCANNSPGTSHKTIQVQTQSNSKIIKQPDQAPIAGESDLPKSKRKNKKRGNKEDRRKRREEKFYQALYQNKDSHIQFVSADVIRKLQSDTRPSALKAVQVQTPAKNLTHSGLAFPTLISTNVQQHPAPSTSKKIQILNQSKPNPVSQSITVSPTDSHEPVPVIATESEPIRSVFLPSHDSTLPISDPLITLPILPVASVSKKKKSKQPMVIDVGDLIVAKKMEKEPERKMKMESFKENYKVTTGNMLDSSGPGIIHRGKIRQKKKKPTKLKLSILKSRTLKRILLEENEKSILRTKLDTIAENESDNDSDDSKEAFPNTDEDKDKDKMSQVFNSELLLKIETKEAEDSSVQNIPENILPSLDMIEMKNVAFESGDTHRNDEQKPEETVIGIDDSNASSINDSHRDDSDGQFLKLLDNITTAESTEQSIPASVNVVIKSQLHNRKFRDYCDMFTSRELYVNVNRLLSELYRFQDRLYHNDPIKFKTKRRMVSGLKDAFSYLNLNKVQLLVIAPDIEKNPEPGGLDERVAQILLVAKSKNVPYVFAGNKYILGRPMRIKTPMSIIAVLDKQNCEETFRKILDEATQLREKYDEEFITKAKQYMDEQDVFCSQEQ